MWHYIFVIHIIHKNLIYKSSSVPICIIKQYNYIYISYNKQKIVFNKLYNFITFKFIKYKYSVDLKTVLIYSISLFVKLLWINLSYYIHSNCLVNKYYFCEISKSALDLWNAESGVWIAGLCGTGPWYH